MGSGQSQGTGHFSQLKNGQSHRTGHLIINEVASPMGLATFKRCRHQAESGSYWEWPVPTDWPLFSIWTLPSKKWPVQLDWPLYYQWNGQSHGTGHFEIEKSGQSDGTGHSTINEVASPIGLATLLPMKWPVPSDWPLSYPEKWAVPWDWPLLKGTGPIFHAKSGQSRGKSHV